MKPSRELRMMNKALMKHHRYSFRIIRESEDFRLERKEWYSNHKHHARLNTALHWIHKNSVV